MKINPSPLTIAPTLASDLVRGDVFSPRAGLLKGNMYLCIGESPYTNEEGAVFAANLATGRLTKIWSNREVEVFTAEVNVL